MDDDVGVLQETVRNEHDSRMIFTHHALDKLHDNVTRCATAD
jgi:hypothetical protein